jgi:DNA-binding response OmpR family regulator
MVRGVEADSGDLRLPVMMLTASGGALDHIAGLELGADDYINAVSRRPELPHPSLADRK